MYQVYFLRSQSNLNETYIGHTDNLARRITEHNTQESDRRAHTRKHRPWAVEAYLCVDSLDTAVIAERYFKSNSGREKIERVGGKRDAFKEFVRGLRQGESFGSKRNRFYIAGQYKDIPLIARITE